MLRRTWFNIFALTMIWNVKKRNHRSHICLKRVIMTMTAAAMIQAQVRLPNARARLARPGEITLNACTTRQDTSYLPCVASLRISEAKKKKDAKDKKGKKDKKRKRSPSKAASESESENEEPKSKKDKQKPKKDKKKDKKKKEKKEKPELSPEELERKKNIAEAKKAMFKPCCIAFCLSFFREANLASLPTGGQFIDVQDQPFQNL